MVRSTNVVSSKALGADNKNNGKKAGGGEFGAKLTKIVENVKEIVATFSAFAALKFDPRNRTKIQ